MTKSRNSPLSPIPAESVVSEPFGLIAWLEKTRVQLPLKGVETRFDICGELVSVQVDQVWHQDNPQTVHCLYTFPLPAGAAVHRCELHVNGRLLVAKVEELAEARRLAAEKKEAGHRTALVEYVRENVFELALGNLAPGDVVVVRFAYVQSLERDGTAASLRIPVCPGVRYIPGRPLLRDNQGRGTVDDTDQVPDASRITPPRIDALHPDAAYISVEGRLADPASIIDHIVSPSHPLLVRDADGWKHLELVQRGTVPDRDFIVRWQENAPTALVSTGWGDGKGHCLVRLVAPEEIEVTSRPQDVYFLLDRSGSMDGRKWEKACAALQAFRDNLSADDRVWLTLFESGYQDFAERPLPAVELGAQRAWKDLASRGTAGGTELLPALQHVLLAAARHSAGRPSTLVLITDGQIGNETEIEQAIAAYPALRVHVFGIDTAVNDGFLQRLARQQRGSRVLATPNDDIPALVSRLASRLRCPVVTDLVLPEGWEAASAGLPDLHAGEVLSIALAGPAQADALSLSGRGANGEAWTTRIDLASEHVPAVRLLWARERLAALLARGERTQAVKLAIQHNLLCEGTAFVAWDPKEKVVADSTLDLYQPVLDSLRSVHCLVHTISGIGCTTLNEPVAAHFFLGMPPVDRPPRSTRGNRNRPSVESLELNLQACRALLRAARDQTVQCEGLVQSLRRLAPEEGRLTEFEKILKTTSEFIARYDAQLAELDARAVLAASEADVLKEVAPELVAFRKQLAAIERRWLPWLERFAGALEELRSASAADNSRRAGLLKVLTRHLKKAPKEIAANLAIQQMTIEGDRRRCAQEPR